MALIGEMQYLTIGGNTYSLPVGGGGTVTSVAVSNATNGGLSVSGSPISSSGTITIGHSNVLSSAQTTQAVYPITIDKNGHISAYGTAVTIPVVPTNVSAFTNDAGYLTSYVDENVKQEVLGSSSSTARPILLSYATISTSGSTIGSVYRDTSFHFTPSTGTLQVKNINLGSQSNPGNLKISNHTLTSASSSTLYTITLPDKTGTIALTSDIPDVSGFITTETDPVFSVSAAAGITSTDITNWNGKLDTSYTGSSNTLTAIYTSSNGGMLNFVGANSAGTVGTAINLTQSFRLASVGTSNKSIEFNIGSSGLHTYVNTSSSDFSIFSIDTADNTITLHNLVTPTANTDAATKKYVDDSISGVIIPTKTSDLTNDSGFVKQLKVIVTENNGTYFADKTFTELQAAYNNGYELICQSPEGGSLPLLAIDRNAGIIFEIAAMTAEDIPAGEIVTISATNEVTHDFKTFGETDPIFTESAAAEITSADITNWNNKISDDKTWNGVELNKTSMITDAAIYVPYLASSTGTTANITLATSTPTQGRIAKYDISAYLKSTTPSANDNSTKVATTAYVDNALSGVTTTAAQIIRWTEST